MIEVRSVVKTFDGKGNSQGKRWKTVKPSRKRQKRRFFLENRENYYPKKGAPYRIKSTYRKQSRTSWLKPNILGPGIASACIAPALWVIQGTERKRTRAPSLN